MQQHHSVFISLPPVLSTESLDHVIPWLTNTQIQKYIDIFLLAIILPNLYLPASINLSDKYINTSIHIPSLLPCIHLYLPSLFSLPGSNSQHNQPLQLTALVSTMLLQQVKGRLWMLQNICPTALSRVRVLFPCPDSNKIWLPG